MQNLAGWIFITRTSRVTKTQDDKQNVFSAIWVPSITSLFLGYSSHVLLTTHRHGDVYYFHKNVIPRYVAFCVRIHSFSVMILSFTRIVPWVIHTQAVPYSLVYFPFICQWSFLYMSLVKIYMSLFLGDKCSGVVSLVMGRGFVNL